MCAYKDSSDLDQLKKREYLKQQHQLRTMTKTTNVLSADDMIENLLSKKEIFKMKKDATNTSKNKAGQVMIPYWLTSGNEPVIYKRVWDIVGTPTGYADTPKLTNILLTSRLTTDVLGYIWSLSNSNLGPALLQHDTYTALALVALAQSGYGFTSSVVLNTLKEAPIPKLEHFNEVPVMSGMTMTIPEVPTSSTMSSLGHIVSTACPPLNLPPTPSFSNSVVSSITSEFASKSTTPIATSPVIPTGPTSAASLLADNLSLLDLDMPSSVSLPKTQMPGSASSILDDNSSISVKKIPVDNKTHRSTEQKKELINNFIKPKSFITSGDSTINEKKKDAKEIQLALADDLFGDFQSVQFPQEKKSETNDDIEFDDFKSADFTPLTLLEVKEKPPELKLEQPSEPVPPSFQEKTAAIEDLFPKCVVKPKEDGIDLLVGDEDKYSALRGLTSGEDYDEFGDFLTAAPAQPSVLLPPLVEYQANIQERAMEACFDILEEAKKIFQSIEEVEVLNEVVSDPRGVQYLEELIEVERIAQRLQVALNKEEFIVKLEDLSKELLQFLEPHKNSYMEEETGPKCGICLSEKGPAYVKYGINNFHAPCANLYLHKVDSNLPIAPVM